MTAVLQLTDLHIFEDATKTMLPIDTKASFCRVLEAALSADERWELVVLSGDLADLGEEDSYRWIAEQIRSIGIPTVALPGNHDDRELMAKYFDCPKSMDIGGWSVSFLDSCIPPATKGELGAAALDGLSATLNAKPDTPHLVFLHHPPVLLDSPWMDGMGLTNAAALWQRIDGNANVIAIAAGHAHQNFDAFEKGTRVLVTPSTCTQFVPRTNQFALDGRGPGYRCIKLGEKGQLSSSVRRVSDA